MTDSPVDFFPPYGLHIEATDGVNSIELRALRDEDIAATSAVSAEEIYGKDIPEHAFGWLFIESPVWERAQHRWTHRANISPQDWSLDLAVIRNDEVIGIVDLRAQDFAHRREVETGSWLYHRVQGQGIGKLVRRAAAQLCFVELEAQSLTSVWVPSNGASAGVSAAMGYEEYDRKPSGEALYGPGLCELEQVYGRLKRATFERMDKGATRVTITGVTPQLKAMLGA